jgi:restriction endonuclease Mrr
MPGGPAPELAALILLRLKWLSYLALLMLIGRLLNESGHESVNLLDRVHLKGRRSGMSGIDMLSIVRSDYGRQYVAVQVKRYANRPVSRAAVDTFRGAMIRENYSQGLLITTSTFAPKAWEAAAQHPTHPIYLVDGQRLAQWLLELRIGVEEVKDIARGGTTSHLDVDAFERLEAFAARSRTQRKDAR